MHAAICYGLFSVSFSILDLAIHLLRAQTLEAWVGTATGRYLFAVSVYGWRNSCQTSERPCHLASGHHQLLGTNLTLQIAVFIPFSPQVLWLPDSYVLASKY